MRYLDYWWLGVRQAWDDTMAAFGWTRRHPIIVVAVFILMVVVLSGIDGNPKAIGEVVKAIAKAAAILAIFPLVFVFDLFVISPYRLYQAQQENIAAITTERDALSKKLTPRLQFDYLEDCCKTRQGAGQGRHNQILSAGVRSEAITVRNAVIRIDIPSLNIRQRGLAWHGHEERGAPIQIDPAPTRESHYHFLIARTGNVTGSLRFVVGPDGDTKPGEYPIVLSVTGDGLPPTVAHATVRMSKDGVLSIVPKRGGWFHEA